MTTIIHFFNGIDEQIENHYFQKEYRNDVIVQVDNKYYEVYFFTQSAIEYELRDNIFFSSPGLIILDEIKLEKIVSTITFLIDIGYFNQFIGYDENPINNRFINKWYANQLSNFNQEKLASIYLK